MSERVLFSAQKNEGPFLLEWVAYHRVIGFSRIVVVSNDCDDGSDVLLDRLAEAGVVEHIRQEVPQGVAPQANAERVAREAGVFRDGDWIMWLDADEFLLPSPPHQTVEDLIAAIGDAAALMMAWRFFGDNHHKHWPGRHVSSDFTLAARRRRGQNAQVKTLFRHGPEIERLDIHRPVLRQGVTREDFPVVTSAGNPADDRFYQPSSRPFNRLVAEQRPYILGQVAHFSIRTPDMYARKPCVVTAITPIRRRFRARMNSIPSAISTMSANSGWPNGPTRPPPKCTNCCKTRESPRHLRPSRAFAICGIPHTTERDHALNPSDHKSNFFG